jgi:hypothetical protein
MTLEEKITRLVTYGYDGGVNGTCYLCPYASPPLRRDGSAAPSEEVSNDPTEAYFRCSLPGRNNAIEWGEYAVCSLEEWIVGAVLPDIERLQTYAAEVVELRLRGEEYQTTLAAANDRALRMAEVARKSDQLCTALLARIMGLKKELKNLFKAKKQECADAMRATAKDLRDVEQVRAERDELLKTLRWLDRWLGHKPMAECTAKIKAAIDAARKEP